MKLLGVTVRGQS